jgi:hypothetical protein
MALGLPVFHHGRSNGGPEVGRDFFKEAFSPPPPVLVMVLSSTLVPELRWDPASLQGIATRGTGETQNTPRGVRKLEVTAIPPKKVDPALSNYPDALYAFTATDAETSATFEVLTWGFRDYKTLYPDISVSEVLEIDVSTFAEVIQSQPELDEIGLIDSGKANFATPRLWWHRTVP